MVQQVKMYLMYDYNKEMWVLCSEYGWKYCVFETSTAILHIASKRANQYLIDKQIWAEVKIV